MPDQKTLFAEQSGLDYQPGWFHFADGCQWHPMYQRLAYSVEVHAAAVVIVATPDDAWWPWSELRLCAACAKRPEFSGLEQRAIAQEAPA